MKIYDYKGRKNLCGNRVKEARARLKITQEDCGETGYLRNAG